MMRQSPKPYSELEMWTSHASYPVSRLCARLSAASSRCQSGYS
jgi:hypothetical protein